ncbi:hypothetical protein COCC4DRAFT_135457 [Bipolaris maydis ATCC 48331]|uniref:Uncharacterized protein n=3 Tax=Cochliobolus heterostrophus TaxID=5016 RepID=M2SM73_COCH5|nr:uncharacterized protein COCC4DRAFT_135457 [Bipolaris maydis ATCC 48331]EMD86420.1 hypothetical protein COCHEDRAFT_1116154 [Bipolaris maydis C5]ENI06371.1 hypothetical protein COCC4DRAFT_135457 [Bipolaris maydis ATCC 48331]KAJ6214037.1 hypothetical protein PSV09DRAFT_1116154 [Bipolaris maydis]
MASEVAAVHSPSLEVPAPNKLVTVRVIDTGNRATVPAGYFMEPHIEGHEIMKSPQFSFLIEHSSGKKILFDLATRKDPENLSPVIRQSIAAGGLAFEGDKDVVDILEENGIKREETEEVVWSHWHLDPARTVYVDTVSACCGISRGKWRCTLNRIGEDDLAVKRVEKLAVSITVSRGRKMSYDNFSIFIFLLLYYRLMQTRSKASSPLTLNLDELPKFRHYRPSPYSTPPFAPGSECPGALILNIHPQKSPTKPFYTQKKNEELMQDYPKLLESTDKMSSFDGDEHVLVLIAYDATVLDTLDFFPEHANDWKERGWKSAVRWTFLQDFKL